MRTVRKITASVAGMCMLLGLAACGGTNGATAGDGQSASSSATSSAGTTTASGTAAPDELDGNTLDEPLKWDKNGDLAKKLNCLTRDDFAEKYRSYVEGLTGLYADIRCAVVMDGDSATIPVLEPGNGDLYYYGTETITVTSLSASAISFDADATKFKEMKNMAHPDSMVVPSTKIVAVAFKKNLTVSEQHDFTYETDGAKVKAGEKTSATLQLMPQYTDMVALRVNTYVWLVKVLN
ncbi:hypothetical protein G1C96_0630 [Bifidobacterium sp. DSM 109958]|uniref:Lipoprotein n=1 Tax=Bifidobacterium moraviense TaxID=2675323 RepID=A0A7Y0HZ53_9BIFI|nr:hypothetical protein [Bifidobacterium sp. DSM 109958]NMN00053.1 hypothetical protein [Bifidobacterium sp. DSM 109958]